MDRRSAIRGAVGAGLTTKLSSPLVAQASEPIVESRAGKLRGRTENGVHVFKGVRYGASTGGSNRFLPPQPVEPWTGVRDALAWGAIAPQIADAARMVGNTSDLPTQSEDCLFLNVFTPEASRAAKRPVMVWLHGGGWWVGSGSEPMTEGSNLAKFGDMVIVTLNHRLNVFGYLKLEDNDGRFADPGNTGVLDMVAALKWVRDNISEFGGDPDNVTIFGYAGGGAKVTALMAAPVAQGASGDRCGNLGDSGDRGNDERNW